MSEHDWKYDKDYKTWNLTVDGVFISITQRAPYCDRGRYICVVTGLGDIDRQDEFPRYFMDLERAKAEMVDWLLWRMRTRELPTAFHQWNAGSMLVCECASYVSALKILGLCTDEEQQALQAIVRAISARVHNRGSSSGRD